MRWDSRALDLNVARVIDVNCLPVAEDMDRYDLIVSRIPMGWDTVREQHQAANFDFVTLDIAMTASPTIKFKRSGLAGASLVWLSKERPLFSINGFVVEDSRFMRDTHCRKRLPVGFWDKVINEHCSSYADMVACALDQNKQQLIGMISCFIRNQTLELFLVAVHPEYQSRGIGKELMAFVAEKAIREELKLKTEVLATNIKAMNFYLRQNFVVESGEVVMHRWTKRVS